MIISHKIELDTTRKQRGYFTSAAGCARFVWNQALAEWDRQYQAGEKPSGMKLKKEFNATKYERFSWMKEIHRDAHAAPFANLDKAFRSFFKGVSKRPKFKKKGSSRDSFAVANDKFRVNGKTVILPKIGRVRMTESLRFTGKILGAVVSRTADRWFISIQVDVGGYTKSRRGNGIVGVDLGVKVAATLSTGEQLQGPKPLKAALKKLARASRELARRKKGSKNRQKTKAKLAKIHYRVSNIRKDWLQKHADSRQLNLPCSRCRDNLRKCQYQKKTIRNTYEHGVRSARGFALSANPHSRTLRIDDVPGAERRKNFAVASEEIRSGKREFASRAASGAVTVGHAAENASHGSQIAISDFAKQCLLTTERFAHAAESQSNRSSVLTISTMTALNTVKIELLGAGRNFICGYLSMIAPQGFKPFAGIAITGNMPMVAFAHIKARSHKTPTRLCHENQVVAIESLNVAGMVKNKRLARSVSDIGFGEFSRQMEYKSPIYGTELAVADRWYPSSKTCSTCGHVKADLTLKDRTYNCESCGLSVDRDLNAALNLRALGLRVHAHGRLDNPGVARAEPDEVRTKPCPLLGTH